MVEEETAVGLEETSTDEEELSEEEKLMAKLKEAISVTKEEIGSLRLKLTITVPRDTLDGRLGEEFDELKREALVPGFRKGRAPLKLIEKRFGSDVGDRLVTQMLSSGYLAAIEKEKLDPLGDPLIWATVKEERTNEAGVVRMADVEKLVPVDKAVDCLKLPKEGPLTFSCEIELNPEFELPELDKIPVEQRQFAIEDKDVDEEIRRIRTMRGSYQPVEGKIKKEDLLYVDMKMIADGEVVASEENFDLPVWDTRVKGVMLKGLTDATVGKKLGDEITLDATVPDDHESIDLRGKTATFSLTVREIKRLELPPIDEDFLASIGAESEKELRSEIRSAMESRVASTLTEGMRDQIAEYLLEKTKIEIPEGLSQRSTERAVSRRMMEMYASMPPAEVEKAADQMRSEAREQTVKQLKLMFILDKIGEQMETNISEEELNGAIAQIAARRNMRFDRVRDDLSKGDGLRNLAIHLRDQKVLEELLKTADITETKAEPKKSKTEKKPAKKAKKATTARKDAGADKTAKAKKFSPAKKTTKAVKKKKKS